MKSQNKKYIICSYRVEELKSLQKRVDAVNHQRIHVMKQNPNMEVSYKEGIMLKSYESTSY